MARDQRDIGRYQSATLIGRGGYGSVYMAHDQDHGRQVAIKVLDSALGETERRRFDRERQAVGQLGSHPNIISVFESGYTDDGEGYLVMELATGGSLREQLERSGALPPAEAVELVAQIAGAVGAAHDRGIIHRDIKPDNILIDEYGRPRLTDFGIAAMAGGATSTQAASATLAHAAPEVLDGKPGTQAIDIYALGSTLHTLLAGQAPFVRDTDDALGTMMRRILAEPPPDLRTRGISDALAREVERSLEKDPERRHPDAPTFAAAIRAAVAPAPGAPGAQIPYDAPAERTPTLQDITTLGGPPAPEPPGLAGAGLPDGPVHEPRRGRAPLVFALAAVLFLALAGTAVALRGGDDETQAADGDLGLSPTEPSTDVEATTTAPPATSTTTTTEPTTTTPTTVAPLGQVSIDCPDIIPLGSSPDCHIITANVTDGHWHLPGFLGEPLEIPFLNDANRVYIEPGNAEAAGRRYTLTATVTGTDGITVEAAHEFLVPEPEVEINCPEEVPVGDTIVCEIVSRYAVAGSWDIPDFGGNVLETVPGSNPIYINPTNPAQIGNTFTLTATVEDGFGLSTTESADFTVGPARS